MKLSNKVYDILKYAALIAIPAVSFLVGSLGDIWEVSNAAKIVLTINAFGTFLGILLQISTAKYHKEEEYHG